MRELQELGYWGDQLKGVVAQVLPALSIAAALMAAAWALKRWLPRNPRAVGLVGLTIIGIILFALVAIMDGPVGRAVRVVALCYLVSYAFIGWLALAMNYDSHRHPRLAALPTVPAQPKWRPSDSWHPTQGHPDIYQLDGEHDASPLSPLEQDAWDAIVQAETEEA